MEVQVAFGAFGTEEFHGRRFEVTNLGMRMAVVVVLLLGELELELVTGLAEILFLALPLKQLKQNGLNSIYSYLWSGTDCKSYHLRKRICPSYHCNKIKYRFQR